MEEKTRLIQGENTMFEVVKGTIVNFMTIIRKAFDDSYNEYECWDEWCEYELYSKTNLGLH